MTQKEQMHGEISICRWLEVFSWNADTSWIWIYMWYDVYIENDMYSTEYIPLIVSKWVNRCGRKLSIEMNMIGDKILVSNWR